MPTGCTGEGGLVLSVFLVDTATLGALPGGIVWIDISDRNPGAPRLVGDKGTELGECPIAKPCSLGSAGRDPATDALEVLKRQSASGAFSIQNERLRYAVVGVLLEPRLLTGEFAKEPLSRLCTAPLDAATATREFGSDALNVCAGTDATVAIDRERDDAQVNSKPVFGIELGRLGDVAGRRQHPFAADKTQIDLAFAIGHQPGLMLAHHNRDGDTAFHGPDADRGPVTYEADNAIVVGLGGILAETWCDLAVDFECVGDLGDGPHGSLRGQAEAGP